MSSSAPGGSAPPAGDKGKKQQKGLSRVVSRMKTILKKSDGSKRLSFAAKTPTTPGPSAAKAKAPTAAAVEEEKAAPAAPQGPQPTKVSRADINAERARKLGERFKLNIEPEEWATLAGEKEAWRIEKPIRMRIHRTCHKCNTTFGANKVCANCDHPRCTKCPRYPLKKKDKGKGVEAPAGTAIEVDTAWKPFDKIVLTKPSNKVGGQPLVRKMPMQRVRRNCCECKTLFLSGNKTCTGCSHVRCADCPRDPAKKNKYPDGYPGDRPSATTKKFACHECDKTFPVTEDDKTEPPECTRCKHVKCDKCTIALPRRVIPQPDPEVLKRIEAKMAELNL